LKCIHVAGTNGKGSTSSYASTEPTRSDILYTSHLKDFRERNQNKRDEISENLLKISLLNIKAFFESNDMSFFEMTVGLAFDFATSKVDIAIIEVGMGGRLDATNIINPLVSVVPI
jgi:dihydrofolate synthase/folylpolyglutamate synthase